MKYMKRTNIYKASNVCFDPELIQGKSYDWWLVVRKVGNKVLFNNYGYSMTTRRHQAKLRILLSELNIKIDLVCEAPKGLQDLTNAISYHQSKVEALKAAIAKPRSQARKNEERTCEIISQCEKIEQLKEIQANREKHEFFA